MSTFKNDYIVGTSNENRILEIITKFFNDDIVKSNNIYCKYDFKGTEYLYELKTRNNTYNKYPTTLIPLDKLITNKIIFLFDFQDGLYYIKYDKLLFDSFETKKYVRNIRSDYNDKVKDYVFIPIEKLTRIML